MGTRIDFRCLLCDGGNADVTWKLNADGQPDVFAGCFSASCRAMDWADWIAATGRALGLGEGATKEEIAAAVVARGLGVGRAEREPERLPSSRMIEFWRSQIGERRPRRFLRERGLSRATVRRYGLGYDPRRDALVMPVYADGVLVNERCRFLAPADGTPKIVGRGGRGSQIYPDVPPGRRLLVGEGELDALILRQHGFPAVTSTAGTSWSAGWNRHVRGRRVAVMYDAGAASLEIAERRAAEFVAAGAAEAWAVDLASAGLAKGEDATDWFMTHGRSAADLRALIRAARRAA